MIQGGGADPPAEFLRRIRAALENPTEAPLIQVALEATRKSIAQVADEDTLAPNPSDLSSAVALALAAGRHRTAYALLRGIANTYSTPKATSDLRLEIAAGLTGVGALALRFEEWEFVRAIALLPSGDEDGLHSQPYLIPAGRLEAARAGLLTRRTIDVALLGVADEMVAAAASTLCPDLPSGDPRIIESICQFNALASLAQRDGAGPDSYFAEFRRFSERQTDSAFRRVVVDVAVRSVFLPRVDDTRLAWLLRDVTSGADQYFARFGGWRGFGSRAVQDFLKEQPEDRS